MKVSTTRFLTIAFVASVVVSLFSCDGDAIDSQALTNKSQVITSSSIGYIFKGIFYGEADASFQQDANDVLAELLGKITTDDEKHHFVKKYPDFYGGAYITGQGRLVVFIHGDFEEGIQQVKSYVNDRGIIDYVSCKYSFQELTDIMNNMNDRLETLPKEIKQNIVMYYIKDDQNKVIVSLRDNSIHYLDDFQKNVINHPAIEFTDGSMSYNYNMSIDIELPQFQTEIQPGGMFFLGFGNGAGRASWAFRARKENLITNGMVTVAHAFISNDSVFLYGEYVPTLHEDVYDSLADVSFVRIPYNSPGTGMQYPPFMYNLTNKIRYYPNAGLDSIPDIYLSKYTSEPGVGTVINKRGGTTGHTSGIVISSNYTGYVSYRDNDTIYVKNRMIASFASDHGDSGGIVYTFISSSNTRYTVGVLNDFLFNNQTNEYFSFFTKADVALSVLGLHRY